MTRVSWGAAGERYFEIGVDRGVLYVGANPGVPWIGLTAVTESPSGGEPRPYYIDGVKYLNLAKAEEFEGTIEALSSPKEFRPCEGIRAIQNGLLVTQQTRVSFGLSYRTKVGNDTQGQAHAYKIHIVYNALARPAQRNNTTKGETVDPVGLSWGITTLPPAITGYRRTAHLIVDSRYTDPGVLTQVEDILYGSESLTARIPTPDELIEIFES